MTESPLQSCLEHLRNNDGGDTLVEFAFRVYAPRSTLVGRFDLSRIEQAVILILMVSRNYTDPRTGRGLRCFISKIYENGLTYVNIVSLAVPASAFSKDETHEGYDDIMWPFRGRETDHGALLRTGARI